MRLRNPLALAILVTFITAVVFTARYGFNGGSHLKTALETIHPGATDPKDPEPTSCTEHLAWLEPYQFTYPIQYVSRDIIARPRADAQRPAVTIMDKPLFDKFATIDLAQSQTLELEKCQPPLELEVPHGSLMTVDASNMLFGMQTTMNRLNSTVKHLARWLPNTGARLYAIVIESEEVPAKDDDMRALEKEFADLGMNVHIVHPVKKTDFFAQRYLSLVHVMYAARDEQTQWLVTIDDDTFFPSMWDLQNELKKHDWTTPHYVGSLSEDWWAVNRYGLMAFGGAGVFLSLPMAKIVDDHMDDCKNHLRTSAGDISIMDCVYKYTSTKLTHVSSLHQVDMHGDLSGFYESGREILSLHHWKEGSVAGYKLEMEKIHLIADICDSCFLQRWQFPNDLVLSNGFSIASYPQGHLTGKKGGVLNTGIGKEGKIDKINLQDMEETWEVGENDRNTHHSLAPVRAKLSEDEKIGYKLLDSMLVDNESSEKVVRQIYFKEGGETEVKNEDGEVEKKVTRDTVMVLNWRSGPPKFDHTPQMRIRGRRQSMM